MSRGTVVLSLYVQLVMLFHDCRGCFKAVSIIDTLDCTMSKFAIRCVEPHHNGQSIIF